MSKHDADWIEQVHGLIFVNRQQSPLACILRQASWFSKWLLYQVNTLTRAAKGALRREEASISKSWEKEGSDNAFSLRLNSDDVSRRRSMTLQSRYSFFMEHQVQLDSNFLALSLDSLLITWIAQNLAEEQTKCSNFLIFQVIARELVYVVW